MFGVISPTLESMRLKASYIDDISSASVLSTIVKPTPEDPLQSLELKWMQLDLPLRSTKMVKNRDFVYMEATGIMRTEDGEEIGYHIQHSIGLLRPPSCRTSCVATATSAPSSAKSETCRSRCTRPERASPEVPS